MNNYGNNILIPFDMIYDTDIGIFNLISNKYRNPKYINENILSISKNNFKYNNLNTEVYDPIEILLKDDFKSSSKNILEEILKEKYNDIIDLSEPTDILTLSCIFMKTNLIKITILCKNNIEYEKIKSNELLSQYNYLYIIKDDYNKVNIKDYDSIFIKNYRDALKFKNLEGKSIFVGNYKFNQEKNSNNEDISPLSDISVLIGDTNRIYFINIYSIDDTYPIYG